MKLLKFLGTILLLIGILPLAYSQTNVSGTINNNSTWSLVNSPYVVTGNVTVNQGVTLTIEPGVVVKFQNAFYTIRIRGKLQAVGSAADSIVFTSYKDDNHGGDTNGDGTASSPASEDWSMVTFDSSSDPTSQLGHCLFIYGGREKTGCF